MTRRVVFSSLKLLSIVIEFNNITHFWRRQCWVRATQTKITRRPHSLAYHLSSNFTCWYHSSSLAIPPYFFNSIIPFLTYFFCLLLPFLPPFSKSSRRYRCRFSFPVFNLVDLHNSWINDGFRSFYFFLLLYWLK